jgi:chromosome segregation ATPase
LLGQRGTVATAGDLRVLQIEYAGLLARRARLQAELDGSAKIAFPPELPQQDAGIARVISQEQAMFAARRDALRSETDVLNQLKTLLNGEVTSLQAKIKNLDQEIALLKQELASTSSLVQRGLAAAPREFTLRQSQLQTEGRRLDLDAAVLRAREDIGKADQALIQLRNKRNDETLTEFAQVESKLSQTAAKMRTSQMLLAQDSAAPDLATIMAKETGPPLYTIVRGIGERTQKIAATELSAVEPGDTIEVLRGGLAHSLPIVGVGDTGPGPRESETPPAASAGKGKPPGR